MEKPYLRIFGIEIFIDYSTLKSQLTNFSDEWKSTNFLVLPLNNFPKPLCTYIPTYIYSNIFYP